MKITLLMLFVCLAPLRLFAQEYAQKPAEPSSAAQPAPVQGHPLDPNDVAILTGRASASTARSPYAAPRVVYGYTTPSSFGYGQRFGFNGFFIPGPRRFGAPFLGAPFGPFFFSGFPGGWR